MSNSNRLATGDGKSARTAYESRIRVCNGTKEKTKERRIDDGRRSNDLRQHGEGRGFPRVESTYRLRSRRSSKFPVINYRVDDRVPPFLLPTSFLSFLPSILFFSRLPSPPLLFFLPFGRLTGSQEPYTAYRNVRSNHVWSPFIKSSSRSTCIGTP